MDKDLIFKQFSDVEKTRVLLQASVDKYEPYNSKKIFSTIDEIKKLLSEKIEDNETEGSRTPRSSRKHLIYNPI